MKNLLELVGLVTIIVITLAEAAGYNTNSDLPFIAVMIFLSIIYGRIRLYQSLN